jgi:hypothetical protein
MKVPLQLKLLNQAALDGHAWGPLDDDGLDPIEALVADAAAAEGPGRLHESGSYYAERIIKRAIAQGTLILAAQGIEAGTAETVKLGSVHESPVAESDAPNPLSNPFSPSRGNEE